MTSHRQVFRSSAIIGGASAVNMLIGIVKVKILALLLGPVGIGLMGLYQNVMGMTSKLASAGLDVSGVRQLAASTEEEETLALVRRALWLGNLVFGIAGMAILWLMREIVAKWVFGDSSYGGDVGWLGIGLLLTVMAGSQTAVLQGLRRIGELARVSVVSAAVGASVGTLAVLLMGRDGVLWFVLVAPAANFLVASFYVSRLPSPEKGRDLGAVRRQWLALIRLGIPLMSAALITLITQLAARSIVLREFGLDASGHFQAAWTISFTYVGFVLNAMAMDYFPRLTASIDDHQRAARLVNEQSEMALLLIGPMLMAIITLAPLVIHLLYAESFGPAADILRWQALGDVLKVTSVPIVFVFLATGHGGIAIGIQVVWGVAYLAPLMLGIDKIGLVMAGIGFWIAYLVYCLVAGFIANRLIGFKPTRRTGWLALVLLAAGALIVYLSGISTTAAYATGSAVTLMVSIYSWFRLNHLINLTGWLREKFG